MTVQKYFPLALSWCNSIFSVNLVFMKKFEKQNGHFLRYSSWYLQKVEKCPICSVNFSVKTRSTEKIEYTTTKPTENTSELSSQIFDF